MGLGNRDIKIPPSHTPCPRLQHPASCYSCLDVPAKNTGLVLSGAGPFHACGRAAAVLMVAEFSLPFLFAFSHKVPAFAFTPAVDIS